MTCDARYARKALGERLEDPFAKRGVDTVTAIGDFDLHRSAVRAPRAPTTLPSAGVAAAPPAPVVPGLSLLIGKRVPGRGEVRLTHGLHLRRLDGLGDVLDQDHQVQRIGRRRFEAVTEIEAASFLIDGVDEHRAHTDRL